MFEFYPVFDKKFVLDESHFCCCNFFTTIYSDWFLRSRDVLCCTRVAVGVHCRKALKKFHFKNIVWNLSYFSFFFLNYNFFQLRLFLNVYYKNSHFKVHFY